MPKNKKLVIKPKGGIRPSTITSVTVVEHGREIHMYRITDTELDTLTIGYHSLNLFFFSLCIGALLVFVITLLTVSLPDRTFAVFIALTATSGLLGGYFGLKVRGERRQIKQHLIHIRESRGIPGD